jgi:hypothetical protein
MRKVFGGGTSAMDQESKGRHLKNHWKKIPVFSKHLPPNIAKHVLHRQTLYLENTRSLKVSAGPTRRDVFRLSTSFTHSMKV